MITVEDVKDYLRECKFPITPFELDTLTLGKPLYSLPGIPISEVIQFQYLTEDLHNKKNSVIRRKDLEKFLKQKIRDKKIDDIIGSD